MPQNASFDHSSRLRARADVVLPAGGYGNFDPSVVTKRSLAGRVWDVDGKEYVDFLLGSGPMLVGHGHPEVIEALKAQLSERITFFTINEADIELAEVICGGSLCRSIANSSRPGQRRTCMPYAWPAPLPAAI